MIPFTINPLSERLNASAPELAMLPATEPVTPPLPSCSVPLLMVVEPLVAAYVSLAASTRVPAPPLVRLVVPPVSAPVMMAVAAFTLIVRMELPLRSMALAKVSVLLAETSLSTRVVGANVALPHVRAVGLAVPPMATVAGAPTALKPLTPPVI